MADFIGKRGHELKHWLVQSKIIPYWKPPECSFNAVKQVPELLIKNVARNKLFTQSRTEKLSFQYSATEVKYF